MRKRVDGEHGRNEHTGITDFKTWDAFADEISFIWRNAKDYNEDGSEMFELAIQFEVGSMSPTNMLLSYSPFTGTLQVSPRGSQIEGQPTYTAEHQNQDRWAETESHTQFITKSTITVSRHRLC